MLTLVNINCKESNREQNHEQDDQEQHYNEGNRANRNRQHQNNNQTLDFTFTSVIYKTTTPQHLLLVKPHPNITHMIVQWEIFCSCFWLGEILFFVVLFIICILHYFQIYKYNLLFSNFSFCISGKVLVNFFTIVIIITVMCANYHRYIA